MANAASLTDDRNYEKTSWRGISISHTSHTKCTALANTAANWFVADGPSNGKSNGSTLLLGPESKFPDVAAG